MEYINGIFTSREQAHQSAQQLQKSLGRYHNREPLQVKLAYNENHLGGAGDVVQAASQMLMSPISNYDLHTMLRKVEEDDTTRKLLLVGHSQGSLYANSLYDYITAHGSPARSVDVYSFATPSSYVAGGGKYLTSSGDAVIYGSSLLARSVGVPVPLPPNISLQSSVTLKDLAASHSLETYLSGALDRVIEEIGIQLDQLQSTPENAGGPCFEAPDVTAADKVQGTLLAIADPLIGIAKNALVLAYKSTATIAFAAGDIAQVGQQALQSMTSSAAASNSNPFAPQNEKKNFLIVKKFYGSSLDEEMYEELNGAQVSPPPVPPSPVVAVAEPAAPVIVEEISTPVPPNSPQEVFPAPYIGGSSLPPQPIAPFVEIATTTGITSHDEVDDNASTTPELPLPPPNTTEASTTPEEPPPPPAPSPAAPPAIADTFDTFNSLGWGTFGSNAKLFDFDGGTTGACFAGGCVVGMGENQYNTAVPRMYVQQRPGLLAGAYSVYAKAQSGFNSPNPVISLCKEGSVSCLDATAVNVDGIHFFYRISVDAEWHKYYVAWRQGTSYVESCILKDDMNASNCAWVETDIELGTKFDGIALWSANGFRSDVGPPHANLWFDELKGESVQ